MAEQREPREGEAVWIIETFRRDAGDEEIITRGFVHQVERSGGTVWRMEVGDEDLGAFREFRFTTSTNARNALLGDASYSWREDVSGFRPWSRPASHRPGSVRARCSLEPVGVDAVDLDDPQAVRVDTPATIEWWGRPTDLRTRKGALVCQAAAPATIVQLVRDDDGQIDVVVLRDESRRGEIAADGAARGLCFTYHHVDDTIPCETCGDPRAVRVGGRNFGRDMEQRFSFGDYNHNKDASWPPCKQCKGTGRIVIGKRWTRLLEDALPSEDGLVSHPVLGYRRSYPCEAVPRAKVDTNIGHKEK